MLRLFECQPSALKPATEFITPANAEIPTFWEGYIAIFAPGVITKSKFHTVYYFATKAATLSKALHYIQVQPPAPDVSAAIFYTPEDHARYQDKPGSFYWEYKRSRPQEAERRDLPKNRYSKPFSSKNEALMYWQERRVNWLQAKLLDATSATTKVIAVVNTTQTYSEKFL